MVSVPPLFIELLVVIISIGGSYLVANHQVEKQEKARQRRETEDWYRRSSKLADRTEADWFEVMTRNEASYEVVPHEVFNRRRDDLEDHAADGRTRPVDSEIVDLLDQAAAELNVAASVSEDYYETEQRLLAVTDRITELSQEEIDSNNE